MAAVQKLDFVRLWTSFHRFSRDNGSTGYDETSFLYSMHTWEGYKLLVVVIQVFRFEMPAEYTQLVENIYLFYNLCNTKQVRRFRGAGPGACFDRGISDL